MSARLAKAMHDETLPPENRPEHSYAFSVTLVGTFTCKATSVEYAERILRDILNGANINAGSLPNGDPLLADVSIEGDIDLDSIDGEAA